MHAACNPDLPDVGEVWYGVVAGNGEWLVQEMNSPFTGLITLSSAPMQDALQLLGQ